MKKIFFPLILSFLLAFNLFYFVLTADSFYQEYVLDRFVYWGYPQWGLLYADAQTYFYFNLFYLIVLFVLIIAGVFFWSRKYFKISFIIMFFPFLSALMFLYMPTYNWNRQFAVFNQERHHENSRIPEGKWWVSVDQMERYSDVSLWEKLKGCFGRGEWPGGYAIWGDYRVWLLPDFKTNTLGRRGMVFHGGTKNSSPWGIDLGDQIIDFAIQLRRAKAPLEININYGDANKNTSGETKADPINEIVNKEEK